MSASIIYDLKKCSEIALSKWNYTKMIQSFLKCFDDSERLRSKRSTKYEVVYERVIDVATSMYSVRSENYYVKLHFLRALNRKNSLKSILRMKILQCQGTLILMAWYHAFMIIMTLQLLFFLKVWSSKLWCCHEMNFALSMLFMLFLYWTSVSFRSFIYTSAFIVFRP